MEVLIDGRGVGRRGGRRPTRRSPPCDRVSTRAAATARAAVAAFETHLRDVVLPASDGEGRLGAALFAQKMRHTMRSETLTPGADHGRGRARVRRGPGRDGPPGARPVAGLARRSPRRRTTRARSSGACSTPSPPSIPKPTTCSTSAAPRTPGSRRSAWSATSSAWPTSRSRSSGRRSSCARSGARCSRHPDRWTRARRRSSRSPRCPTTGARSSASRTCARTTTGCSDC